MHDSQHKYIDDPSYTRPGPYSTPSLFEIFKRVSKDERFDGVLQQSGEDNIAILLAKREEVLLEHWNAWMIDDATAQFEELQRVAAAMLVATSKNYDFFLCHVLTTSHAVRIMLPLVPAKFQVPLLRQWLFFALTAYVSQMRPKIDLDIIQGVRLEGKGWKTVVDKALNSSHAQDSHFVKGMCLGLYASMQMLTQLPAVRAMKDAAETWDDKGELFLKAAVKFTEEFDGWRFG